MQLPEMEPLRPVGESVNVYGIGEIARDYCGLPYIPRLIPGFWVHGWQPDYYHIHPEVICPQTEEERETRQWFARESQAAYLRGHGYVNTKAIGHPITYLPPLDHLRRRPGSLLVMPARTFEGFRQDTGSTYAEEIGKLREHFAEVFVCISPQSLHHGDWLESFLEQGLPVIRGTIATDRHGFMRCGRMMSQFEYVTTNGNGSHIAYAAYFGAKVSVWGPPPLVAPPEKPQRLFARFPHLRDEFFRIMDVGELVKHEPRLAHHPAEAELGREWGIEQLGADLKLTPAELMEEFRWTPEALKTLSRDLEAQLGREIEAQRAVVDMGRRVSFLEEKLQRLETSRDELKAELKETTAAGKSAAKELEKLRPQSASLAWKLLGKPLYSIEKKLKRSK